MLTRKSDVKRQNRQHKERSNGHSSHGLQYTYSNPVDIFALKRNVVESYEQYVVAFQRQYEQFLQHTLRYEKCPVCDTHKSGLAVEIHGFEFVQCSKCTHVYNTRKVPDELLVQYYEDASSDFSYSATYSKDEKVQQLRYRSVATPKVDYICGFFKGQKAKYRRWLDIACGNGDLLAVAKSRGFDTMGIEMNPALAEAARKNLGSQSRVFRGTLPEFYEKTPEAEFDVVGFIGILDIVPNLRNYLNIANRVTRRGGLLVIDVPNYDSLTAALQRSFHDQTIRFAGPNSLHIFTRQSLTEAVRRSGYKPVAFRFLGMDIYELINMFSLENFRFRNSKARDLLMRLTPALQEIIDRDKLSDEMMIVAQKVASPS